MSTTRDEDRLRELLRAAVPEAPEVAPPTAPRRSRGPVVAALAAAAAVAAIVAAPVVLDRSADAPADGPPAPTRTTDPYDAAACPAELPGRGTRADLPPADHVVSVRLCVIDDPKPSPITRVVTTDVTAPDDALVEDVDGFWESVAARPRGDDWCDLADYLDDPWQTSVSFGLVDGRQVAVTADACTDLRPAGSQDPIRGGELAGLFLEALDAQRSGYAYTSEARSADLPTCGSTTADAPVRPSRDEIESAVLCPPPASEVDGEPRDLRGDDLASLRGAWAEAQDPSGRDGAGYEDGAPYVVVRTELGDDVRLSPVADGLLLAGPARSLELGPVSVVPITIDDLSGG